MYKPFTGFPKEGIQFMQDLVHNNNKEWFTENKQTYVEKVQEPALELVVTLGEALKTKYPNISYEARKNGGSLLRIYRDTRFSKDKSPYKTNIPIWFAAPSTKRLTGAGFGLQITPEQVDLVAGLFGFDKDQLDAYRKAVDDEETGSQLVDIIAKIEAKEGYTIGGKELKRVPKPYDKEHPRGELLKHKGLSASPPSLPLDLVYRDALVDALMEGFDVVAPVYLWLADTLPTPQTA